MEYYTYGYPNDVPLIKNDCCNAIDTADIEEAVTNAVMSLMPSINDGFDGVNTHIDSAKDEIIASKSECHCGGCGCDDCNICLATKCDINDAVNRINEHIDSKFNEIDFLSQFSDLNQQIETLING